MDDKLRKILPCVQKPARYTGGEYGAAIKDKRDAVLRMALCFPDTYEIGMSNLGVRILYGLINEMPGVWCERAFAPWVDMENEMRLAKIPLWALESGDPVSEFDIIGFSLGYEMSYTSVLNMLDLAGLRVGSDERSGIWPLIVAGGTSCVNPEPMSRFIDIFLIGEGEELVPEFLNVCVRAKKEGWDKQRVYAEAAKIEGVYIPALYNVDYNDDGTVERISPVLGAKETVTKRIVEDFENSYYPVSPVVPSTEIAHDRVSLELFRGCIRGCRFCQAGFAYRPVRERGAQKLIRQGIDALENTGYQEVSLLSLSSSDYRGLSALCDGILDWCEPRNISLSLPSLRADNFSMDIMSRVQRVRKTGLTFAPEAGSQRLRDAINKNVTEEEILSACRVAFEGGAGAVKLYFMLGLPTETDEDVLAIADICERVLGVWKRHAKNKARGVRITVSTSCFVPKPHTPFQWEAQNSMREYERKVKMLRERMRSKAIIYNWHDAETGLIEAALSRGDRRLGAVIERAWKAGGRLESWSEFFSLDRWLSAFEESGLDPSFYACRERKTNETLPWSHISVGVSPDFLRSEKESAAASRLTPDCREGCSGCGANRLLEGGMCSG